MPRDDDRDQSAEPIVDVAAILAAAEIVWTVTPDEDLPLPPPTYPGERWQDL